MTFWKGFLKPTLLGGAEGAVNAGVPGGGIATGAFDRYQKRRSQRNTVNTHVRNAGYDPYAQVQAPQGGISNNIYPRTLRQGGHVDAGEDVIVNDGPNGQIIPGVTEAFIPDVSGTVVPNADLRPTAPDPDTGFNAPLPNVLSSVFGDLADTGGIAPKVSASDGGNIPPLAPIASNQPVELPPFEPSTGISPRPMLPMPTVPNSAGEPMFEGGTGADQSAANSPLQSRTGGFDFSTAMEYPTVAAPIPKVEAERDPAIRAERLMSEGASQDPWYKRLAIDALRGLGAGGLGGAIGGGLTGVIGKGLYRKQKTQRELGEANQQLTMRDARRKSDQESQKRQADYQHVLNENQAQIDEHQYNQLVKDPRWEIAKSRKMFSQSDADYFNQKLGTNLSPASWQTFVEKVDPATGADKIRGEFDPRYSVNPTISPDATVPPVSINAGGIPLTLKQPAVGNLIVSENNANASRTQQTNLHNSTQGLEAAKANLSATQTYNAQILKNRSDVIVQQGKGLENAGEMTGLNSQLQTASDRVQRAGAAILYDGNGAIEQNPENAKAVKEFHDAQADFGSVQAKLDAALGKTNAGTQLLMQLQGIESQIQKPAPISAVPVPAVQTNTITAGGKVLSKATVKAAAKQNRVSYSEALKQAQAQGYTIQ